MAQPSKCQQSFQPRLSPVSFSAVSQLYIWKQHRFQLECIYTYSHIKYLKACQFVSMSTGQIGASHLGYLPGNEVYQCVFELVNVLAKMLVSITIV